MCLSVDHNHGGVTLNWWTGLIVIAFLAAAAKSIWFDQDGCVEVHTHERTGE